MLADLALSRVIPELVVLSPGDTPETAAAILTALKSERMTYVRVGRQPVPDLHEELDHFPIGEAEVLRDGGEQPDVLLVTDGSMAWTALQTAWRLEKDGTKATVVNLRTLKPLDERTLVKISGKAAVTFTIENHSLLGGVGGAVAEVLSEQGRTVKRLGAPDAFGETGSTEELRALYHLDVEGVFRTIRDAI
jgi:transketolase